jgi:hypothetical protein
MADIQYTIGAKDNATPAIDKVGGALDKLTAKTKEAGDTAQKSMNRITLSFADLAKGAGVIAVANLAVQGLQKAWSSFTGSLAGASAAYDTQVEAVKGLETALRLNGEEVSGQSATLQKFAGDLQALTGVGDEVTLGLMKQASMLGVSADKLQDTAKAAIGLAEATGGDLEAGLRAARLAQEGNFTALQKIIPALKDAATDEEKLAMVQAFATKGLEAKVDASNRLVGAEERAAGAVGDLMEVVGSLLAPVREVIAIGIKAMAEALTGILAPAATYVADLFEKWKPIIVQAIEDAVNAVVAGITIAEVIFANFGSVVGMVIDSIKLKYETYRADTEHLFVTTIPAYLTWFADNFFNIIETAFSAVYTVISNHISKISDAFTAFWNFIASRGGTDLLGQLGEIAGRSYLDGFSSSIESMPTVAERALTEREQELQNKIGETAGNLAKQFNEKFAERAIRLGEGVGDNLAAGIDLALKKQIDDAKLTDGISALANKGSQIASLSATESRLLTRGPGSRETVEDLLKQVIRNTSMTATASMDTAAKQAEIESRARETRDAITRKSEIMFASPPV